jgi:hypothetical protein
MHNQFGIGVANYYANYNVIFHNNLVNNTVQVQEVEVPYAPNAKPSNNSWDDGYPSGGNYWSDDNNTDLHSRSHQNQTGSDGIGDIGYVIDENNTDHYPLMGMFSSFNTSSGYVVDVVSNSTIEDFAYFESNSTVTLHVSNMTISQTDGFCRLTISRSARYTTTVQSP